MRLSFKLIDQQVIRLFRMSYYLNGLTLSFFVFTLCACGTKPGDGALQPGDFSPQHLVAEDYVIEIDSIRSALAQHVAGQIANSETFVQVCKPVGKRAMELSEVSGWTIEQVAIKYRNPAHKADELAVAVMQRFEDLPELYDVWERILVGEDTGWRYFYPIRVQSACLACHGAKESRPDFIVQGYPEDQAYNFMEGDLRGLYSVFVPDSSIVY